MRHRSMPFALLVATCLLALGAACSSAEETNEQPAEQPRETASEARPEDRQPVDEQPQDNPERDPEEVVGEGDPESGFRGRLEDPDSEEQKRAVELIEKVTGKKFKKTIPVYVYTAEELEEEVASWGEGFVPDNIMGFYKPSTKSLYLVPEVAGNRRAFGLRVHEATHGLQDQLYDLAKLHELPTSSDENLALIGLIEGHAVQVMIDALIDTNPHVAHIAKIRAPEGSRDEGAWRTVFCYAGGTRFIQYLKEQDGYVTVDEAFSRVPVSTEMILHPEKYDVELDLPDHIQIDAKALKTALPEGWKVIGTDTLGEFGMQMMLRGPDATYETAEALAEGWGGDLLTEIQNTEDARLALWITTWDTEEDAAEFAEGIAHQEDFLSADRDGLKVTVILGDGCEEAALDALKAVLAAAEIDFDPTLDD